jgi:hypothetical protein
MTTGHKALKGIEIKDEGRVKAVFATFNVKDLDGDVTLPEAFDDGAPVRISAYGHASWGISRGASSVPIPPVGKGVIRTTASEAILDGQFFMNTTAGRDHYELVKEMGDQQEWSYGYDTLDSGPGDFKGETVNILRKQRVHEVSPVMLGAGIDTRTLEVKSADETPPGGDEDETVTIDLKVDAETIARISKRHLDRINDRVRSFPDEASDVLGGIRALVTRAEGWGSGSDAKAGRVISSANRDRLREVTDGMAQAMQALESLLAETDLADPNKELFEREFLRFEHLRASL